MRGWKNNWRHSGYYNLQSETWAERVIVSKWVPMQGTCLDDGPELAQRAPVKCCHLLLPFFLDPPAGPHQPFLIVIGPDCPLFIVSAFLVFNRLNRSDRNWKVIDQLPYQRYLFSYLFIFRYYYYYFLLCQCFTNPSGKGIYSGLVARVAPGNRCIWLGGEAVGYKPKWVCTYVLCTSFSMSGNGVQ